MGLYCEMWAVKDNRLSFTIGEWGGIWTIMGYMGGLWREKGGGSDREDWEYDEGFNCEFVDLTLSDIDGFEKELLSGTFDEDYLHYEDKSYTKEWQEVLSKARELINRGFEINFTANF